MDPLWSKQPFKLVYFLFLFLKIPAILLSTTRYIVKSFRPLPQWSYKTSVLATLLREYFKFAASTRSNGMNTVLNGHKKSKDRVMRANPSSEALYTGVLAPGAANPASVGGLWFPSPPLKAKTNEASGEEKIVLHFPGGAFILAFGHEKVGDGIHDIMARNLGATRTLLAQYRPAENEHTRFPAAVQDLLTFYSHVLSLGVDPVNIVLSGDSTGGNLVLALIRYLEATSVLPLPAGAMVWSPWVEVTDKAGQDFINNRNSKLDVLVPSLLQWGVDAYFPSGGASQDVLPYISPRHHPFQTKVPLFIHTCGAEAFFDSIRCFANAMSEINGDLIRFHSTEDAFHNLLFSHEALNLTHQLETAVRDARQLFDQKRAPQK